MENRAVLMPGWPDRVFDAVVVADEYTAQRREDILEGERIIFVDVVVMPVEFNRVDNADNKCVKLGDLHFGGVRNTDYLCGACCADQQREGECDTFHCC